MAMSVSSSSSPAPPLPSRGKRRREGNDGGGGGGDDGELQRDPDRTLYIGNLPFNPSDEQRQQLHDALAALAPIEDVAFRPKRGFAWVTLRNADDMLRVVQGTQGLCSGGRALKVERKGHSNKLRCREECNSLGLAPPTFQALSSDKDKGWLVAAHLPALNTIVVPQHRSESMREARQQASLECMHFLRDYHQRASPPSSVGDDDPPPQPSPLPSQPFLPQIEDRAQKVQATQQPEPQEEQPQEEQPQEEEKMDLQQSPPREEEEEEEPRKEQEEDNVRVPSPSPEEDKEEEEEAQAVEPSAATPLPEPRQEEHEAPPRSLPTHTQQQAIRNISIIAHVDHGKTTLSDQLLHAAGKLSEAKAGKACVLDVDEEAERGITIASSAVALTYSGGGGSGLDFLADGERLQVNMIDSPGHVDFNSEVTAALRLSDGALVVVDALEGVCVQTETVVRQAVSEGLALLLVLNKVDRLILEKELSAELVYEQLVRVVAQVNGLVRQFSVEGKAPPELSFAKGTVCFGSGFYGWMASVDAMDHVLGRMLGKDKDPAATAKHATIMRRLRGDAGNANGSGSGGGGSGSGGEGKRSDHVVRFVLKPILSLHQHALAGDHDALATVLAKAGISLPPKCREVTGRELVRVVMRLFLPVSSCLLRAVRDHLPPPHTAQPHRAACLYPDSPEGDACFAGIRDCDSRAPLMMFVSKMVPLPGSKAHVAVGRVFSGCIRPGTTVRVLCSGGGGGTARVQRVVGLDVDGVFGLPCLQAGEVGGVVGLDAVLAKSGTITDCPDARPMPSLSFAVSPVIKVCVRARGGGQANARLATALQQLRKADTCLEYYVDKETKQHVLAGTGQLHIEVTVAKLRRVCDGIELDVSDARVSHREGVRAPSTHAAAPAAVAALRGHEGAGVVLAGVVGGDGGAVAAAVGDAAGGGGGSGASGVAQHHHQQQQAFEEGQGQGQGQAWLGKTANKHNRFWFRASRLDDGLVDKMERGALTAQSDATQRARVLVEQHGWDRAHARKVMVFGDKDGGEVGCNVLVDCTSAVQHLHEVKDLVCAAFVQVCQDGPLCGERLRGVRVDLVDAKVHAEIAQRRAPQVVPACARAIKASVLAAGACLLEPMLSLSVQLPSNVAGKVHSVVASKRGAVLTNEHLPGDVFVVGGVLPVKETKAFNEEVRKATSGRAFPSFVFCGWREMGEAGGHDAVQELRKEKGLSAVLPTPESLSDRL